MKTVPLLLTLLLMTTCAVLPSKPAWAHLADGDDVASEGLIIDFGWDPSPPVAGKDTTFAINVLDEREKTPVPFASAWVRITSGETLTFAGTIAQEATTASFAYAFPHAGDFEVSVRPKDGEGKMMADATFPVQVVEEAATPTTPPQRKNQTLPLAAAGVVALVAAAVIRKRALP